jgi:WD40 repeat protein/serine/threonine protein kinase/tetratricopeptide (TPR) repeat protein
MADKQTNLDSLFLAAVEIESPEQRAVFLTEACGGDLELRNRVEQLLASHQQAGSSPRQSSPELEATILPDLAGHEPTVTSDVGLAVEFLVNATLVMGGANHGGPKSPSNTIQDQLVALQEVDDAHRSKVQLKSPEVPVRNSEGRYELQGEIARGGMGAILKGRDMDLGRDLAIKVLLDEHKHKPDVIQRFIEEAQIGGQLQHPGIAPVYELGQFADRRPFFSMKLVKGETLSKLLADRAEPAADRGKMLAIFEQVCQTMAYAHSRGVIHRDLKPANVMVGAFAEVQVMDWGLAKVLPAGELAGEKSSSQTQQHSSVIQTLRSTGSNAPAGFGAAGPHTQMGSIMGTPAYMPPEQALGDIEHLDERADVFGLGAILCEILTGKPPYVGVDGSHVFRLASRGKLDDCFARLDVCNADPELIALSKHCLELEPNSRPSNAGVLAQRVAGYLQSVETRLRETELERAAHAARADAQAAQATAEGLRAEAESRRAEAERQRAESEGRRLDQQLRSTRKLRMMFSGVAAISLIAIGAAIIATRFWQAASIAGQSAHLSEELALSNAEHARKNAETARKNEVLAQKEAERANEQTRLTKESLTKAKDAERDAHEQRTLAENEREVVQQNLYTAQMHLAQQAWREHRGLGQMRELLANWVPEKGASDRRGWEWFYLNSLPYQNLRTLARGEGGRPLTAVAWHVASNRLADGNRDGLIRIWDVEQEQTKLELQGPVPYLHYWGGRWFAWSSDGDRLAAGFKDGSVRIWDSGSGRELQVFAGHNSPILTVAFSSDGGRLAAWHADGKIRIWDSITGQISVIFSHPKDVSSGSWSPDDKSLACGHSDGSVTVSNLGADGTGADVKIVTLNATDAQITSVAWSPDSTRLVSASTHDQAARIWDVASQKVVLGPLRHSHEITTVAWSPDGEQLATGSIDDSVKVWNTTTGNEVVTLRGNQTQITSVVWGPAGQLASGAADGSTKIWNTLRDQESNVLSGHVGLATTVAWSPNGERLASGGNDGTVRIWDAAGKVIQTFQAHDSGKSRHELICSLVWNVDGAKLASAGIDGKVKVWDVESGREIFALPGDHGPVGSVAWSSNGFLAAGSDDGTIRIVASLEQSAEVRVLKAHSKRVRALAWSPQGDRLASGSWGDHNLKIWDSAGTELNHLEQSDQINTVAWSADGKRLATGTTDTLVAVWDTDTRQKLATMRGHHDFVDSVAWSPDGTRLVSAGLDNSVRVWDSSTGNETFVLRGNTGMFRDVSWRFDGAQIAAACSDGQIWIWNATRGFERDATSRAAPFIDRKVAMENVRGEEARWCAESFIRAKKFNEALSLVQNDPYGLAEIAQRCEEHGERLQAEAARDRILALLQLQFEAEPNNSACASKIAGILLKDRSRLWTLVKPTEIQSKKGAVLTLLDDGSILASGPDSKGDVYTFRTVANVDSIAAVYLEVLPDASLPNQGPGRHPSGNFQISAVRLHYPATESGTGVSRLPLTSAWASFNYLAFDADIAGLVDERLNKVWHVWGRFGQAHHAVFTIQQSARSSRDQPLVIELHHKDTLYAVNLGRFRLFVSDDPSALPREQMRAFAPALTDPWAKLAAAYHIRGGKQQELDNLIKIHPTAAVGIADLHAAIKDWGPALIEYNRLIAADIVDTDLLVKRATVYGAVGNWQSALADWRRIVEIRPDRTSHAFDEFKQAQRWNEAAEFGLKLIDTATRAGSILWLRVAPVLALADDREAYLKYCARMIETFAKSEDLETAERVSKVALLRANSIDLTKLPALRFIKALDEGTAPVGFRPWGWACRALLAYRSGDADSAVKYVTESEKSKPGGPTHGMSLAVLALAKHQLKLPLEAQKALKEASQVIASLQEVPDQRIHHDVMIAEILVREARAIINGETQQKPR